MSVYLITYDLNTPGQNYDDLYEEIKSLGTWAHYMRSVWFVDTYLSSDQVRDKLKPHIDQNDYLFICRVTRDYDGWAPKEMWEWLSEHVKV